MTVYRGYALGNKKFTASDKLNAGDKVVVYGKLVNFKGTKEFTQGNYIYSLMVIRLLSQHQQLT